MIAMTIITTIMITTIDKANSKSVKCEILGLRF